MDRGYWVQNIIEISVLDGAHVYGTIKRCSQFPFAHRQKLKYHDKRVLIEEEGTRKLEKLTPTP